MADRLIEDHRRDPDPHPRLSAQINARLQALEDAAEQPADGVQLGSSAPPPVSSGSPSSAGQASTAARSDHRHELNLPDGLVVNQTPDQPGVMMWDGAQASSTVDPYIEGTVTVDTLVATSQAGTGQRLLTAQANGTQAAVASVVWTGSWLQIGGADVAAVSANGLVARTAAGAFASRAVAVTAGHLTVSNGDGVAGNPTLGLPNSGAAAGNYGTAAKTLVVTVDAQGRVTSITQPDIAIAPAQAGADPAGTASAAVASHVAAGDPHTQYPLAGSAETISGEWDFTATNTRFNRVWDASNQVSFTVGGTSANFYPVLFASNATNATSGGLLLDGMVSFAIYRPGVHQDGTAYGSWWCEIRAQSGEWGHRPPTVTQVAAKTGYGSPYNDCLGDVAGAAFNDRIVVWLRGGATYQARSLDPNTRILLADGNPTGVAKTGNNGETWNILSAQQGWGTWSKDRHGLLGLAVIGSLFVDCQVPDGNVPVRIKGATGGLRLRPYVDNTYQLLFEGVNAAETGLVTMSFSASEFNFYNGPITSKLNQVVATDGTGFARLHPNGDVTANRGGGTGAYYFASGVDKYVYFDGASYIFGGAYPLYVGGSKVWTEGNDGSGSGMDADTVDGQHASSFAAASHTHPLSNLQQSGATTGQVATWNGSAWAPAPPAGGGVTDHGALTGLGDDDHPQYPLAAGAETISGDWNLTGVGTVLPGHYYQNTHSTDATYDYKYIHFYRPGDSKQTNLSIRHMGPSSTVATTNVIGATWYFPSAIYVGGNVGWHAGNDGASSGLDADLLDGMQPSTAAAGSTIAQRDSGGSLYASYFVGSYILTTDDVSTSSLTYLVGKFGDNYHRSATPAKVKAFLALTGADIDAPGTDHSKAIGTAWQMPWKNYGNGHTITDNSNNGLGGGNGGNNVNPDYPWTAAVCPTLMGWNGANTYGVRVDSARHAEYLGGNLPSAFFNASNLNAGTVPTARLGSGTANSGSVLRGDSSWMSLEWFSRLQGAELSITSSTTLTLNRMHVLDGSSGGFNVTLPSPSGNAGAVIGVRVHRQDNPAWQFKLDTGSTSIYVARRSRYLTLLTGNSVLLVSDGSDWNAIAADLETQLFDGGAITMEAVTTNPTKGTIVRDKAWWRRVGDEGFFRFEYEQSAAGTAGNGDYLHKLPGGATFDSARVEFYTGTQTNQPFSRYCRPQGIHSDGSGTLHEVIAVPYDSTRFRLWTWNTNGSPVGFQSNTFWQLSLTGLRMGIEFRVPVTDW